MKKIFYKGELIAIKLEKMPSAGVSPLTDSVNPLQVLAMNHPKGTIIKPHHHIKKKRTTTGLNECLVVLKGKLKVNLFSPDGHLFKTFFLKSGQVLITLTGGHGYEVKENTKFIEIKNGPFKPDKVLLAAF